MINRNTLYIVYSSDDNYAQHMGVSVYSLLEQNNEFDFIHIFIIENNISKINKSYIESICKTFVNVNITWIDFKYYLGKLKLNLAWEISLSSYARLLISSILPEDIEKVLYLDCDMIICDSLKELWYTNLGGNIIGAVQDTVNARVKQAVGLTSNMEYFNAGLLLIDLKKWRKEKIEEKCLKFIENHAGCVIHHDQGVLNGVLANSKKILSLKYNMMTIHYILNRKKVIKYFEEDATFYSEDEINSAKINPVVLHYTPSFTCRPWYKQCKHPLKIYYLETLGKTPWRDYVLQNNNEKWYVKLINWRYRNLPF